MLFSPLKIGNVEIKNRIVMAPMMMGFGQFNGKKNKKMNIVKEGKCGDRYVV